MANYIVQDTSLETVADSIRAKAGISEKLEFPLGWKAAVDGIKGGGGSVPFCAVSVRGEGEIDAINTPLLEFGAVSANEVVFPNTYALYNGERLPEFPKSLLSAYPYVFIHKSTSRYNLVCSTTKYFYMAADSSKPERLDMSGASVVNLWLTFEDYSAGKPWSIRNMSGYYWENPQNVVWSNYDIPKGSTTATDIYFAGSEPVPTE